MACRKPFGQNLSCGMTSRKHGLVAEYCSAQIGGNDDEFRASLEINFIRKICTFRMKLRRMAKLGAWLVLKMKFVYGVILNFFLKYLDLESYCRKKNDVPMAAILRQVRQANLFEF